MAAPQLEDRLACAICLTLFSDPVTLPCGHSYCDACIGRWWAAHARACPECRRPCPDGYRPPRNVSLCAVVDVVRAGVAPNLPPGPASGVPCPRHRWPLELFCRTESLCVCSACTVQECGGHALALPSRERRERQTQLEKTLAATQHQAAQAESQLRELQRRSHHVQVSAHTVASMVCGKVASLLQALKSWETWELGKIEAAKTQALALAQAEERRVQGQLEALELCARRSRELLERTDDLAFLQDLQQLEPPGPLGPLPDLPWDEEQHAGRLREMLAQPCGHLLDREDPAPDPAPAPAADALPTKSPGPLAPARSPDCSRRRKLWQNYRNLTFDPDSANRHFRLSRGFQQVTHCREPQGEPRPGRFKLWQVQCAQSFRAGHHYWEVRLSSCSVTLGVAYPDLARDRLERQTDNIGRGPGSWGLCVWEDGTQARHNGEVKCLPPVTGRLLGVDLDLTAGRLAFYCLEPETQYLHTFHSVFTQPLRPVFWLLEGRTLTLRHQPKATLPPEPQEEAAEEGAGQGGQGGAAGPGQTAPSPGAQELPPRPLTPGALTPQGPDPAALTGPTPETSAAPGTPGAGQEGTVEAPGTPGAGQEGTVECVAK